MSLVSLPAGKKYDETGQEEHTVVSFSPSAVAAASQSATVLMSNQPFSSQLSPVPVSAYGGGGGSSGIGGDGGIGGGEGGGEGGREGGEEGGCLAQQCTEAPPVVIWKAPATHASPSAMVLAHPGHGHSSPSGRHAFPAEAQHTYPLEQWLTHPTVVNVVESHDVAHRGMASVAPVVESTVQSDSGEPLKFAAHAEAPARVAPVRSTAEVASHVPGGDGGKVGGGEGGGDGGGEGGGGDGGGGEGGCTSRNAAHPAKQMFLAAAQQPPPEHAEE